MAVTETTSESWFSRLGGAFKGIVVGLILVVVGIGLLFWNEGRTIKRYKALQEGESNVVAAQSDKVDPANEGKLIYLTGDAKTDDILADDDFNVSVNAIKLERSVQMFQWEEKSESTQKKEFGGSEKTVTTYSYSPKWSDHVIDSSSFKESGYQNPAEMPYSSQSWTASSVSLGAFQMSPSLVSMIDSYVDYPIKPTETPAPAAETPAPAAETPAPAAETPAPAAETPAPAAETPAPAGETPAPAAETPAPAAETPAPAGETLAPAGETPAPAAETPAPAAAPAVPAEALPAPVQSPVGSNAAPVQAEQARPRPNRQIYQKGYYLGKNPASPAIGDLKITFRVVYPTKVSVVSQQQGDTFVPYEAKTGSVELLSTGIVSCEKMFKDAQAGNSMLAWVLRGLGFVLILIGFNMIFAPLKVLADVIPFLGSLVGGGTGIVSFILALVVSLVTIAVGWLSYRPLIAVPLLVVAAAALVWLFIRGKKRS